jgi:pyruvate/2-oxoglutarate/acetoin dehydrogenase E1 component/TPP-dependent pyruvate/acetoin dehydrogenase alpha subunit
MIATIETLPLEVRSVEENNPEAFKEAVIHDYWICLVSREASLLARKEVLGGKAKFGILGDGKEVPQVAMARSFKTGDWRSGYYRDQTFMFARGLCSIEQFFAQLYADTENDPFSGGRQMNSHYATPTIDGDGEWINHTEMYNVSADISCTGGQMARSLGIAMASRLHREVTQPEQHLFSNQGKEISFVTIGDSSTSEGVFWETLNAAAVMQVPLLVAVWDDGYGISVPVEMQTAKSSISRVLEGFIPKGDEKGLKVYTVNGWDYPGVVALFEKVTGEMRANHEPVVIHVEELTQPQGHSTSGSHERYKSPERLQWEKENDCIRKMGLWMLENHLVSQEDLDELLAKATAYVKQGRDQAWSAYQTNLQKLKESLLAIYARLPEQLRSEAIQELQRDLAASPNMVFSELVSNARRLLLQWKRFGSAPDELLVSLIKENTSTGKQRYESHLYSETKYAAVNVPVVAAKYGLNPESVPGHQVLNKYFDELLTDNPAVIAFGEDVGHIGDVNQGFAGLQLRHGASRVFDTGIREWTIMGQALGSAMRGFRPIAEIQYLDYMAYAFSLLSDDLATLRYRSAGIQKAPVVVRTRGHRLEGIWHAGSPMGMIITSMRGIYLCVPRNMVQAIGMYNTLLKSDDPGIVVECLNGYRLKEKIPSNLLEFTLPLGVPEILEDGTDLTLVTYGSCVREAQKGIDMVKPFGISVELIDVQTLLPFDTEGVIVSSLKKTNRIIFLDEDVPGGATAYMMQEVLEKWDGYKYLDAKPVTLSAKAHRTPFGSDGDYFTKPGADDVCDCILQVMKDSFPNRF